MTDKAYRSELTPVDFLRRSARVYPDKTAVVHGRRRYSYAQFAERAARLASGLHAAGFVAGDRVAILQHAYYSVISPEGCAGILWKSHEYAEKAAQALRFTSGDLRRFQVVDDIIPEPLGGAHRDHHQMAQRVKLYLVKTLRELSGHPTDQLLTERYGRFRRIGVFEENGR